MVCRVVTIGGATAIVCGVRGSRKKRRRCLVCLEREEEKLCDGQEADGKTCDAPLCLRCAVSLERPAKGDTWDFCPRHSHRAEGATMKALTIHAPWAWLIVEGYKPIENRDWVPSSGELAVGEVFAIHQGKSYDKDAAAWVRANFPEIPLPSKEDFEAVKELGSFLGAATFSGVVTDPDDLFPDLAAIPWFVGPNAWRLDRVFRFQAIPWRGYQKLWNVPSSLHGEILRRLQTARSSK